MQSSPATAGAGTTTNSQEQHLRAQLELLKSPDADLSSGSPGSRPREHRPSHPSPPPPASNGYDELSAASQDAARALNAKPDGADAFIHPDLRTGPNHQHSPQHQPQHPVQHPVQHPPQHPPSMMPIVPPGGPVSGPPAPPPGPPTGALPPVPPPTTLTPGPIDDPTNDGRKAKRELSQSKRAAQNRAAQRAFRQRKESYIKQLEQEVRDYREMEKLHKSTQSEMFALREYVLLLQSRLLDAIGEFPPPPPNVSLAHQSTAPEPQMTSHEPSSNHMNTGTPLEAVAQAVAGLAAQEQMSDRPDSYPSPHMKSNTGPTQDTRTADEINRHLQSGEGGAEPPANV